MWKTLILVLALLALALPASLVQAGSPGDGRPASPTEPISPDPTGDPITAAPGAAAESRADGLGTRPDKAGSGDDPAHEKKQRPRRVDPRTED